MGARTRQVVLAAVVVGTAGCGQEAPQEVGRFASAATAPDGLAEAYGVYKELVSGFLEDQHHHIGFGFHPGLSTQRPSRSRRRYRRFLSAAGVRASMMPQSTSQ